jgi:peptidoglycan/LPS O-acetylase OafA/YrhL
MTRTIAALGAAIAALVTSLGYFYVLNDGYAKPTDIAGTLYRFAGSTSSVLLVVVALLIAFPLFARARMRRLAVVAVLAGWVFIEFGSAAFSLMYDYDHLENYNSVWGSLFAPAFIAGYLLMAAGLALVLVWRKNPNPTRVVVSIIVGIAGVAPLLVIALFVREVLFVVPIAAAAVILAPRIRDRLAGRKTSESPA